MAVRVPRQGWESVVGILEKLLKQWSFLCCLFPPNNLNLEAQVSCLYTRQLRSPHRRLIIHTSRIVSYCLYCPGYNMLIHSIALCFAARSFEK